MPIGVYPRTEKHIEVCRKAGLKSPTHFQKNHPVSQHTRDRVRESSTGRKHTTEAKKKISDAGIGRIPWNKGKVGMFSTGKGRKPWNYIDGRSKVKWPCRYGDDWANIREMIHKRDNYTCQDCGIKDTRFDIHHIIPFTLTRDNSPENLVTLCRGCHMKRETKIIKNIRSFTAGEW
jgi:hypothetical protein